MAPCHMACFSKSVSRNVILRSAVVSNCLEVQWVWHAWAGADCSMPLFLWSSCSSGFLRLLLLMTSQSGVCLQRRLRYSSRDSSRNAISSSFPVPPLLIDLLVGIQVGVLIWQDGSLTKHVTREPKQEILAIVGASVGNCTWGIEFAMTSPNTWMGATT